MKRYTFELIVDEGNDEFWESIENTGCDQVHDMVVDGLNSIGLFTDTNCSLKLVKYENADNLPTLYLDEPGGIGE